MGDSSIFDTISAVGGIWTFCAKPIVSERDVYFNNDPEGAAVKNAKTLKRLVSGENA